jgi:hypothetical protein
VKDKQADEERAAEFAKADWDKIVYGTGVVRLTKDGVQHVPIDEWVPEFTGE